MDALPPDVPPPVSPETAPPPTPAAPPSSTGLEPNIAAGLAVLLGWVGGLIFYLIDKERPFVRFYALQSLALLGMYLAAGVLSVVIGIVGAVTHLPLTFNLGSGVFGIAYVILWVILLINAFQGREFELPLVGKWCRGQAGL